MTSLNMSYANVFVSFIAQFLNFTKHSVGNTRTLWLQAATGGQGDLAHIITSMEI